MPTMPTCTSNWNWRATPPSRVKIAVPLPYGFSLIEPDAPRRRSATRMTDEHRPEDLVLVAVHVGRDVVEQRWAEEEAVAVGRGLAAVDDDASRPARRAVSRYEATLSRCSRGDERPHLDCRVDARRRPSPSGCAP